MTIADLFAHPFNTISAQNRQMGNGATFGASNHALSVALQLNGGPNINAGQGFAGGFTVVVLNASGDSSKNVTYNNDGVGGAGLPVTLKLPTITTNASGDRVVVVFDTASNNVYEFYHFSWNSGSPTAGNVHIFDPAGIGHPTSGDNSRVGVSASGCSILVGLIRGTELTSGAINHIMHATLANQSANQQLDDSHVWPAFYVDGYCDGTTKCIGAISNGQLFAIPPTVSKSGLGLSDMGGRLFDQLQNYGLRPIDGAANNSHTRGDQIVTSNQRTEFISQMGILWPLLRPVLNDAEGQTKSGGEIFTLDPTTGICALVGNSPTISLGGASGLTPGVGTLSLIGNVPSLSLIVPPGGEPPPPPQGDEGEVMTLLSIVNDVQTRIDLPRSNSVVGSADQNTIQLRSIANEQGRSMVGDNDWRALISQETFVTTATELQTNFFPANFYKMIDNSMWNRTRLVPMLGPLTSQEWQAIKVTTISSLYPVWRHSSGLRDIQIMPTPAAGETIGYDCMKDAWVILAAGGNGTRFLNDSDSAVFDEELMILGIKWRWLKHKGLDWQPAKMEYDEQLRQMIASDSARRTLSMAKGPNFDIEPHVMVPDRIMI